MKYDPPKEVRRRLASMIQQVEILPQKEKYERLGFDMRILSKDKQ